MAVINYHFNKKFLILQKNAVLLQRKQADKFYSLSLIAAHQF